MLVYQAKPHKPYTYNAATFNCAVKRWQSKEALEFTILSDDTLSAAVAGSLVEAVIKHFNRKFNKGGVKHDAA